MISNPIHHNIELTPISAIEHIESKKRGILCSEIRTVDFDHLTVFIVHINGKFKRFPRSSILFVELQLACRKWKAFTSLNASIGSEFASMDPSTINRLFLGDGLCTAAIVKHFTQFFLTKSPLDSVPLPVMSEALQESGLCFYPIKPLDSEFEQASGHLRYLQAAYRVSYQGARDKSFEYVPKKILNLMGLRLDRRIPTLEKGNKTAFPITDLLKILDEVAVQVKGHKGYLLGLGGAQNHSIAVNLQEPYHFFDPEYGLAVSEKKEEFFLFLANHLTQRYPRHSEFALLEFSPTCSDFHPLSLY